MSENFTRSQLSIFIITYILVFSNSAPLTNDPLQAHADTKTVQQVMAMRDALLAAEEALYAIHQRISIEADTLNVHIKACMLRRGPRLTA